MYGCTDGVRWSACSKRKDLNPLLLAMSTDLPTELGRVASGMPLRFGVIVYSGFPTVGRVTPFLAEPG